MLCLQTVVAELQAAGVTDQALLHTASMGVGYIHEAQSIAERQAVEALYNSGRLGVVVASVATTWGFSLTAALVVIMDTQQYDGREHRYVGYVVTAASCCEPLLCCIALCCSCRIVSLCSWWARVSSPH